MTHQAEKIKEYLKDARIAQVATINDGRPWICTVYIVVDDDQKIYWLSYPERRHSQELEKNPKAAIAIVTKTDQPVIGIQAEGSVGIVDDAETVRRVMKAYTKVHDGVGVDFYDNFVAGTNRHQLYVFSPQRYSLFDELNFPGGQSKEWSIG